MVSSAMGAAPVNSRLHKVDIDVYKFLIIHKGDKDSGETPGNRVGLNFSTASRDRHAPGLRTKRSTHAA